MEVLILLAISPLFFISMLWEYRRLRQEGSQDYNWKELACNLTLAGLHQSADLIATLLLMPFFLWLYQYRLFDIQMSLATVALAFLLQDFCYYWFHRASHHINWLWASHIVHHSSQHMNFTTAFRQSLTYPVSGMWIFWLPLILIGYPPATVVLVVSVNLGFQFFVHTRVIKRLGWLEHIFNTPSHHRVHHARNPEYIDKNFAGVLILWDKLFGTFVPENDSTIIRYGVREDVTGWRPLQATFDHWQHIFSRALAPNQSLKSRLYCLFGPPANTR
ncbi:sterol desaturase family protein [Photobacterium sp. WH77]|uniref:sterol desaturase family protein n=1 Tax=unclassified Photobacterium TaxID=2628852 RepID=UPI001EDB4B5E|nr:MULTISPECIES: sterol desaturase family protein [unclassified Photobacterium]MCG2837224.1 sterol desaturase family protein [Photobacterium sp. WH77]MCG2844840.1 sterol desaturase family protein [Photobacterium sp. WH80]